MPIKSLFVPLTDAQGTGATLGTAFTLAKSFDAHVDVLLIRPDPTEAIADFVGETVSASLVDEVMSEAESRAKAMSSKVRKAFDESVATAGIAEASAPDGGKKAKSASAAYDEEVGDTASRVDAAGRVADITIVRRARKDTDVSAKSLAETALMGTGRPVLLAPTKAPATIGRNVAVAWNGSEEAARAVAAAMPFITSADSVTVIAVAEKGDEENALEGLVRYLGWHGVDAKSRALKPTDDVGKAILSAASRAKADLLVMGAYTHSRVRQIIFGGVTSHILQSSKIPVLLAH